MAKNRHVVKVESGWVVKPEGAAQPSSRHRTQHAAIDEARNDSKRTGGGEIKVHGEDGRFRTGYTIPPAKDPHPPKG